VLLLGNVFTRFVDSIDGSFNHAIRVTTRMEIAPDSTSSNTGFRCASGKHRSNAPMPKPKANRPPPTSANANTQKAANTQNAANRAKLEAIGEERIAQIAEEVSVDDFCQFFFPP
jgi:hypothetical protein